MRRALQVILFWATGCALLGAGVAILTIQINAWLGNITTTTGQLWGSASFGLLFGMLTGLLIAYLHSSGDDPNIYPPPRLFDATTLTLLLLLLGSTVYWVLQV